LVQLPDVLGTLRRLQLLRGELRYDALLHEMHESDLLTLHWVQQEWRTGKRQWRDDFLAREDPPRTVRVTVVHEIIKLPLDLHVFQRASQRHALAPENGIYTVRLDVQRRVPGEIVMRLVPAHSDAP
jgi:hypothetical protein